MLNIRGATDCIASMAFMTKFKTTCCSAAAEDGVALRIDGLQEFGADAAGREIRAAGDAGELPEDEVAVAGIERLGVETKTSLRPLEADFGGVGGLDFQVRIADLERAGCVMGAVGEEL